MKKRASIWKDGYRDRLKSIYAEVLFSVLLGVLTPIIILMALFLIKQL